MKFLLKDIRFFKWTISLPTLLWFGIAAIATIAELLHGITVNHTHINNYLIFKQVFWHTVHGENLYLEYPLLHEDTNHYGSLFSILIAPFALLNDYAGCFLWCMANAAILFYAVKQLPLNKQQQQIVLLIGFLEMITSLQNVQFNPMLTGWIILSYTLVKKEKDFWAALFVVAGLYVKIYGVVGIAFFWFSQHKIKFLLSFIFWLVILFCLPMLISSPAFIVQSYQDWFHSLVEKNAKNINVEASNAMQDISVMGMIRRIFHLPNFKNYLVIVPATLLYALPFLRFKQFKHTGFQLSYLAFALIGVVIFSSSAESATYVLAMAGVGIWFVIQEKNKWIIALLVFALLFTSLSPTDLFPDYLEKSFVRPYSLKALPCFLVWLLLAYDLLIKNFSFTKPFNE
ncbi:MAG: DUF2029 domain-containing protein [Chitinophagaceae bacterium]|nr:DUF2029 domain-containing protein [Chitinophagaceae bacterium]